VYSTDDELCGEGSSRSVESRLVDRALDNMTQSLPEVVDDVALKNKHLTDEHTLLEEQLNNKLVVLRLTIAGVLRCCVHCCCYDYYCFFWAYIVFHF